MPGDEAHHGELLPITPPSPLSRSPKIKLEHAITLGDVSELSPRSGSSNKLLKLSPRLAVHLPTDFTEIEIGQKNQDKLSENDVPYSPGGTVRARARSDPVTPQEKQQQQPVPPPVTVTLVVPLFRFARRLSALNRRRSFTSRPTFYCAVCQENLDIADRFQAGQDQDHQEPSSCSHAFCRACITSYITSHVNSGVVLHPCPLIGQDGCRLVYSVVDADVYRKLVKFQLQRQDGNYRECPQCSHMLLGDRTKPNMTCTQCGTRFCFFHNNAHPNVSCRDYAKKIRKAEVASAAVIRRFAVPCPKCQAQTEKNGGCNHITCVACGHQWCWLCRAAFTPTHYSPTNPLGCPGAQFLSVGGEGGAGGWWWWCCGPHATVCLVYLFRTLALPLCLPMAVLAVASSLCFTLLWLPLGLALVSLRACGLVTDNDEEEKGPPWWALLLPLVASIILQHQSELSPMGVVLDAAIFGFIVLSIIMLFFLQIVYLPLGIVIALVLLGVYGGRSDSVSVIFMPMCLLVALLDTDEDDEQRQVQLQLQWEERQRQQQQQQQPPEQVEDQQDGPGSIGA